MHPMKTSPFYRRLSLQKAILWWHPAPHTAGRSLTSAGIYNEKQPQGEEDEALQVNFVAKP